MKQRDYLILVVTMLIALVMPQDLIAKKSCISITSIKVM